MIDSWKGHPCLLSVPLAPPDRMQKLLAVMHQDLVLRVLHSPEQQWYQAAAADHPADGNTESGLGHGPRVASSSGTL